MKDEKVYKNSVIEKLLKFLTYKLLKQLYNCDSVPFA